MFIFIFFCYFSLTFLGLYLLYIYSCLHFMVFCLSKKEKKKKNGGSGTDAVLVLSVCSPIRLKNFV